jgi:hypothetical protein
MHHDKELNDHRNFYQGQEARRRLDGKVAAHFPEEKAVLTIYDGPAPPPHESRGKLKLIGRAINIVNRVVLECLRWSESLITFD